MTFSEEELQILSEALEDYAIKCVETNKSTYEDDSVKAMLLMSKITKLNG